jgi:hypothetical protein
MSFLLIMRWGKIESAVQMRELSTLVKKFQTNEAPATIEGKKGRRVHKMEEKVTKTGPLRGEKSIS